MSTAERLWAHRLEVEAIRTLRRRMRLMPTITITFCHVPGAVLYSIYAGEPSCSRA
jgi:hypothetical protein